MKILLKITGFVALACCLATAFFFRPDRSVESLLPTYTNEQSIFLQIDGMRVHVRDEGSRADALPIVLIHGTGASLHTWDGWVARLSPTRRCIRFDLPGYGLTGPHPNRDYSPQAYLHVLLPLLDSLQVRRCILAGSSIGGALAWYAALEAPERVAALVLLDPAGVPFRPAHMPAGFRAAANPWLRPFGRWITPRFMVARSTREVYGDPARVTDAIVTRNYELLLRAGNRQALIDRFRTPQPAIPYQRLCEIQAPVLLLWGGKDQIFTAETATRFQQLLPNDTLVVFPHLGHIPMEEDPDATVAVLQKWLN